MLSWEILFSLKELRGARLCELAGPRSECCDFFLMSLDTFNLLSNSFYISTQNLKIIKSNLFMRTVPVRFISVSDVQNLLEDIKRLINLRLSRRKWNGWILAHASSEAQFPPQISVLQVAVLQIYCSFCYCEAFFFEKFGIPFFQFSDSLFLVNRIFSVVKFVALIELINKIRRFLNMNRILQKRILIHDFPKSS